MNRAQRRAIDPEIRKKAETFKAQGNGYGIGNENSKPATGQHPYVNPFLQPKSTGLTITSQTFLNNYYVSWTPETWRYACDQAIKMGWPHAYATLTSWAFEISSFIRSLFYDLEDMTHNSNIVISDSKGNKMDDWTKEICDKDWFLKLKKEIINAEAWGFSCINIDPIGNKSYKYPMQQVDPINQLLRENTFNYSDGLRIADYANLIFIQPCSNYEGFLGWMQPVTRDLIQMNLNNNNWVAAGKRLAFPLMTIGYPQSSNILDENGSPINLDKLAAEDIAKNADPTNAVVFPYTRKPDGTIEKAIEIDFAGAQGGRGSAYTMYQDFNRERKDEIREMVFGENLTSNAGDKGSRALGEVHERKHFRREKTKIDGLVKFLNDPDFKNKLSKFYKNFPKDAQFVVNYIKQWQIEEIKTVSDTIVANGKQLSNDFFYKIGLTPEDIEEKPEIKVSQFQEQAPEKEEKFSLKKKLNLLS